MRTSSLALVAAGLLGVTGLACSHTSQSDSSSSTSPQAAQQDSSQAQTQQLRPAQAATGPTTEQESMHPSGSGMSGMPMYQGSRQGQSARAGNMSEGSDVAQTQGSDSDAVRVQQKTENGISYMCGGVGIDEASYMKQQAPRYDLMLTFSTRSGNYLADVNVDLKDAKGNSVLRTTCDAPILLVDLPRSGIYHVQAQAGNYNLSKTVSVSTKGHTRSVVMAWAQEPVMAATPASSSRFQSVGGGGIESGGGSSEPNDDMSRPQRQ